MSQPIDAIAAHFIAATGEGGLGLGWWSPQRVWVNRMIGDGTGFDALNQPTDTYKPQCVLTPFSTKLAWTNTNRWLKYPVQVAYYDFDFELCRSRAEVIQQTYGSLLHARQGFNFSIPGWRMQLWDVQNLNIVGAVRDADPRLWKAVVNLYFINVDPVPITI
jgi:hypothetical protein